MSKYILKVELGYVLGGGLVCGGEEECLLGETIYNDEDGSETRRHWELFYKIHGDGVPRTLGNGELLQSSIRLVSSCLSSSASHTRFHKAIHIISEFGSGIVTTY